MSINVGSCIDDAFHADYKGIRWDISCATGE